MPKGGRGLEGRGFGGPTPTDLQGVQRAGRPPHFVLKQDLPCRDSSFTPGNAAPAGTVCTAIGREGEHSLQFSWLVLRAGSTIYAAVADRAFPLQGAGILLSITYTLL